MESFGDVLEVDQDRVNACAQCDVCNYLYVGSPKEVLMRSVQEFKESAQRGCRACEIVIFAIKPYEEGLQVKPGTALYVDLYPDRSNALMLDYTVFCALVMQESGGSPDVISGYLEERVVLLQFSTSARKSDKSRDVSGLLFKRIISPACNMFQAEWVCQM
jgi:hypothetical protein